LYRDASDSLTTLERSHRFTMSELDRHRDKLKVSQNEVSQLNRLLSSRDSVIRELCASKKLVSQELEIARRDIKVLEDDRGIMKATCDKAMDKAIRVGRILMKGPSVVVPEDIVADVLAASVGTSKHSPSGDPAGKVPCENAPAQ
jgi:chromosome segregation ATPase